MKKKIVSITILVLIGCTNNTNVGETQSTKEAKQTSRLEITTENTTTIEVTVELIKTPVTADETATIGVEITAEPQQP